MPILHRSRKRATATTAAVGVLVVLLWTAGFAGAEEQRAGGWPPLAGEVAWSLLAVGDTGARPWPIARGRQQLMRVARAMAEEDLRDPVEALVLLGDNFYPDGLRREELDARIRANLSGPFCRFLPTQEVACPVPSRPVPVFAVLGNHDHGSAESPQLQRTEIRRRLPHFLLPEESVRGVELGQGVSLVLYDARELRAAGSFEPLRAALRASAGPWRIAAGHYPLTVRPSDHEGRAAREAIRGLDVPLHLHLAGHRHYLELASGEEPPFLQAIAGTGSNTRPFKEPLEGSLLQAQRPGFVRVDLVDAPDGRRLVVSLVALPDGLRAAPRAEVLARWSVGREGDTRAEPLAGR
jgi:hypothetical protein